MDDILKISLVNMPFSLLKVPSIGLTQLSAVTKQRFGKQVRVRILYLNQEFASYLGKKLYTTLFNDIDALGEWFFRQMAFPQEPDNAQHYFQRFHTMLTSEQKALKGRIVGKRVGLERFMRRLMAKHRLAQEDLVGFTSVFNQNVSSIAMSRLVKESRPETVTVLGGANCEFPMGKELARRLEPVDFVFSGSSLVSFPDFVDCLLQGKPEKCHEIRGVFSRRNADSPHLRGRGALGDELPLSHPVPLDYDSYLKDLESNFPNEKVEVRLHFETSRGCWWGERAHCTFCGLNGTTMAYRSLPAPAALDLFEELMQRYSERCKDFDSVDNIMPREYLKDVFPHLQPRPGVQFFYEVKADLKESELKILSQAGVTGIQPGIESLSTSTLKLMKKGTTAFQNLSLLKNCVRHGIRPVWNILVGFPMEKEDVYRKYLRDIPSLRHLPPPIGAFPVRFDRYSPYHVRSEEFGLKLSPFDFYRLIYPFGEDSLKEIAYYFHGRDSETRFFVHSWRSKLEQAIHLWRARWEGADDHPVSRLHFLSRGESALVADTRCGQVQEHRVSPLGLRILELVDARSKRGADIVRSLEAEESAVRGEIEELLSKRLLFEENDRYLSLVLDREYANLPPLWFSDTPRSEVSSSRSGD